MPFSLASTALLHRERQRADLRGRGPLASFTLSAANGLAVQRTTYLNGISLEPDNTADRIS